MDKRRFLNAFCIAAVLFLAVVLTGRIRDGQQDTALKSVREAVKSAALSCYAVEGAYPETLAYLKENYGLAYDAERFIVSYDAFSENVFPDIRVLERGRTP